MTNKNFVYQGLAVFSLILFLGFMSCGIKTEEAQPTVKSNGPTYPLIPLELAGQDLDTIITFNPDTYEESVRYEVRQPKIVDQENDTIIIFDPKTYKESMTVIRYTNGKADTIQVN